MTTHAREEAPRQLTELGPGIWDSVLAPTETLLWAGRPARGFKVTELAVAATGFLIVANGAILFIASRIAGGPGGLSVGVVILLGFFSLLTLVLCVGLVVVEHWMRRYHYYAVTNERAIILNAQGGQPFGMSFFPLFKGMTLTLLYRRKGSIFFDDRVSVHLRGPEVTTYTWPGAAVVVANMSATAEVHYDSRRPKAFRFIEDAAGVHALIQDAARGQGAAS